MIAICLITMTACLLSLLLTPLTRDESLRLGLVDRPDHQRKRHAVATPRTGGIPILLSYAGVFALVPFLSPPAGMESLLIVWRLFPPIVLILITGLIDDWRCLKPWQKLAGQVVASICAYAAGVRIPSVAGHTVSPWLALMLTVAWLVLCSNAFNLIDGVDGLAAGIGLTATLTTCLAGMLNGDMAVVLVTAPLAGCLAGFLRYNFHPASIFLGDSGSLLIGFLLGSFSIIWSQKSATMTGVAAPVMTLALPLLEVGLSITRRFLRNEPIFGGDRGHIHHKLLDRGFTPRRVALLLYAAGGLAAVISLFQSVMHHRFAGLAITLSGVAACAGIRYLRYAEFIAAGRFLFAGLRPVLGAHVKLETLEESLQSATSVEECWAAIERAGRALGYSRMAANLDGLRFSTESQTASDCPYWQMRLNLPNDCYVNITQRQGSPEQPILVIPFVEIVRRVLPVKLARLNGTQPEMQHLGTRPVHAVPVNSRTRTVMSSDVRRAFGECRDGILNRVVNRRAGSACVRLHDLAQPLLAEESGPVFCASVTPSL